MIPSERSVWRNTAAAGAQRVGRSTSAGAAIAILATSILVGLCRASAVLAQAQGGVGSGGVVPMIVNADAQPEAVYVTWNKVPDARVSIRWREVGGGDWMVRPESSSNFDLVDGLTNGILYEFQPMLDRGGQQEIGPAVRQRPHDRGDCDSGSYVFCTQDRLLAVLPRFGISTTELFCNGRAIQTSSVMPNCRYTWGGFAFGLNRSFGSRFVAPVMRPQTELARRVLSQAVWGMEFDSALRRFNPSMSELPVPFGSRITQSAAVKTYLLQIAPGLFSRISWYTTAGAVQNRYAVFHEGHGETALGAGAPIVNWLLKSGWNVVAMDMPLEGINEADRSIEFIDHDSFANSDASADHMRWFFIPLIGVVNRIYETNPGRVKPVIMLLGRSGGGWTISTYAAMDRRVDIAVDIAGAAPLSTTLDSTVMNLVTAHYEAAANEIYDQISLTDILLAAGTKGAFFFYSANDPCCFKFSPSHPWVRYIERMGLGSSSKNYRVFIDELPQHGLSNQGLRELGHFLAELGIFPPRNSALPTSPDSAR